jgi:hypothetical protein
LIELSAANSIFELAFSVNAVFIILARRFWLTREKIAELYRAGVERHVGPIFTSEEERHLFRSTVRRVTRRHEMLNYVPITLSIVMSAVALLALLSAALQPGALLSRHFLVSYVLVAFVIAPLLYMFQERLLTLLLSPVALASTKEQAEQFISAVRETIDIQNKNARLNQEIAGHRRQLRRLRIEYWVLKLRIAARIIGHKARELWTRCVG